MTTRKRYTSEFQQEAVGLVSEQGRQQSGAASKPGIRGDAGRIFQGMPEDRVDAFRGDGKLTEEQHQLPHLRSENTWSKPGQNGM